MARTESLSFKRFDVVERSSVWSIRRWPPALDSACESIITSAIAKQKPGTRVRSYAATDFMVREQSQQTLLKWKIYRDLGIGLDGKRFSSSATRFRREYDIDGNRSLEGRCRNRIPKSTQTQVSTTAMKKARFDTWDGRKGRCSRHQDPGRAGREPPDREMARPSDLRKRYLFLTLLTRSRPRHDRFPQAVQPLCVSTPLRRFWSLPTAISKNAAPTWRSCSAANKA